MQDLTFNLITIDIDYGKSLNMTLPTYNQAAYVGKRIKMSPIDEYCSIDREEIIDKIIEIMKLGG